MSQDIPSEYTRNILATGSFFLMFFYIWGIS
jgi:hypothetical protein